MDDAKRRADPASAPFTLSDAQARGVEWMVAQETCRGQGCGGVLADEAGSGKTAMVAGLLRRAPRWPVLVCVPSSTMHQWVSSLRAWVRDARVRLILAHQGTRGTDVALLNELTGDRRETIVVAPHSILARQRAELPVPLTRTAWGRVIVDEAHVLKCPKTLTHRAACSLDAAARWAVTATPIQNREADLLALAKFVGLAAERAQDVRDLCVLSRLMDAPVAPSLEVRTVRVELGAAERARYEAVTGRVAAVVVALDVRPDGGGVRLRVRVRVRAQEAEAAAATTTALQLEAQLRAAQAATHAALVYEGLLRARRTDPADRARWATLAARAAAAPFSPEFASAKLAWLAADVRAAPAGERSVVFCEWHEELVLVERALCELAGLCDDAVVTFDGTMSLEAREEALRRFRDAHGPARVLLMQIRSGGCGLNLQAASRVYFMRPPLNPAWEYQAIARAYRRGQTRPVRVVRLVAADTADERALRVQASKRACIQTVLGDLAPALRGGSDAADLRTSDDIAGV